MLGDIVRKLSQWSLLVVDHCDCLPGISPSVADAVLLLYTTGISVSLYARHTCS